MGTSSGTTFLYYYELNTNCSGHRNYKYELNTNCSKRTCAKYARTHNESNFLFSGLSPIKNSLHFSELKKYCPSPMGYLAAYYIVGRCSAYTDRRALIRLCVHVLKETHAHPPSNYF